MKKKVLCLVLCSLMFISVMSFLVGTVTYLGKYKMWLLIITIAIIFLFLGVGYFVSSYKIRKENKREVKEIQSRIGRKQEPID